jgi:hypothetical protein
MIIPSTSGKRKYDRKSIVPNTKEISANCVEKENFLKSVSVSILDFILFKQIRNVNEGSEKSGE